MNFVCMDCGWEGGKAPMEDYGAQHEKRGRRCPVCQRRNVKLFGEEERTRDLGKLARWKAWVGE